jgi:hypothetical protein
VRLCLDVETGPGEHPKEGEDTPPLIPARSSLDPAQEALRTAVHPRVRARGVALSLLLCHCKWQRLPLAGVDKTQDGGRAGAPSASEVSVTPATAAGGRAHRSFHTIKPKNRACATMITGDAELRRDPGCFARYGLRQGLRQRVWSNT